MYYNLQVLMHNGDKLPFDNISNGISRKKTKILHIPLKSYIKDYVHKLKYDVIMDLAKKYTMRLFSRS